MAAPATRDRTMPLSISTSSPDYSGPRPANGVPGQSPPRVSSALPPPFPPQRISSNNHTQHIHTSSDPHYSRSHSRSQPQPPQYQHQYQQYDYRYSGSPTVSSPVDTTTSITTSSTTHYEPVSGPNRRNRHSSYTPRRATDPPRSAPASRNIRFLPGAAGSGNSSPRSPTSPGALPRGPAVNRRHSHDPKRNVYTECGRHSDEWLFGGFSVSGAMRRIWSRENKAQEMEEEEKEERGREL